ncbi:MAG: short-chain dehydrogenase [Cryomorphaceae bacterium MED-G11]|jgi:short-subunit dehydrogenase|nr:MAG: short-chain dehydrogenase [Cryomorphaceae bacterium MED-G11]|tara:strand:+ start:831 stop:1502 length:672 start_codon:yes stop_codon:yes gene_type:complete
MKTIVVTGTSSGIGNEICIQAAKLNYKVISISRNIEPLKGINGIDSYIVDITDKKSIKNFIDDLRNRDLKIDILINNAGQLSNELFGETSYESFKQTFDVNVFGLAEITRSLIPFINKSGHVINISSIGGVNGSKKFPGLSVYSSSKAAVIALTEVLAEEYSEGPSFNVLALGAVQTKMLKEAFPDYEAQTKPGEMAKYIIDFAINGNNLFNGKLISVSNSNP